MDMKVFVPRPRLHIHLCKDLITGQLTLSRETPERGVVENCVENWGGNSALGVTIEGLHE